MWIGAGSDSGAETIKEMKISGGNKAAEKEDEVVRSGLEDYTNIEVTGMDIDSLTEEQMEILLLQAKYCQAMTDADTDTMRELVSEDMTYTHMSGKTQTREEYFADIEKGRLNYFTIGIEKPIIEVDGDIFKIGQMLSKYNPKKNHFYNGKATASSYRCFSVLMNTCRLSLLSVLWAQSTQSNVSLQS